MFQFSHQSKVCWSTTRCPSKPPQDIFPCLSWIMVILIKLDLLPDFLFSPQSWVDLVSHHFKAIPVLYFVRLETETDTINSQSRSQNWDSDNFGLGLWLDFGTCLENPRLVLLLSAQGCFNRFWTVAEKTHSFVGATKGKTVFFNIVCFGVLRIEN